MFAAATQKLIPHFNFTFPGNIWKLKPDSQTKNLVLEVRQTEKLQAGFYSISTEEGKLLVENFQPVERWWMGLEGAQNSLFFLHGYQDKETGRHLGLTAISETDGSIIWHKPQLTFLGFYSADLLLADDKAEQLWEINISTGVEQKPSKNREYAKSEIETFALKLNQGFQVPMPYLANDAYYALLQDFIRKQTGKAAQQTIEYLETGKYIFLSFYAETDSVLANFLLVSSAQGEVLLDFCLQQNVTGLGSDTFFIFANKLIFIQEKTSLSCYLL